MIEISFASEIHSGRIGHLVRKIKRMVYKRTFQVKQKKWCGHTILLLELEVSRKEGKNLGKEWFWQCVEKIRRAYPTEQIYFSPLICSVFKIGEYQGKWISEYFLFAPLWERIKQEYSLAEEKATILFFDTNEENAQFLLAHLAKRVRNCTIVTDQMEKWENMCEEFYEETGMVIDIQKKVDNPEKMVIVDLDGRNAVKYGEWEKTNLILCPCISQNQKMYLKDRVQGERVVCGYSQSLCGEMVEKTFAVLFMEDKSWRIHQLEITGEIIFSEEEMQEIRNEYNWRVEKLETMHVFGCEEVI